jgi:acyl-coenzyme A thioesterase PaaI-like protein
LYFRLYFRLCSERGRTLIARAWGAVREKARHRLPRFKLGKRRAVGEVALYAEGESVMVAHATGTYSIPARGEAAPP